MERPGGKGIPAGTMVAPLCSPVGLLVQEVDVRKYEIMLILPADADDKVIGGVTDRISQILGAGEGPSRRSIGGASDGSPSRSAAVRGFYLVLECQADPAAIKELDRVLSLADEVIRFKVVVRAA